MQPELFGVWVQCASSTACLSSQCTAACQLAGSINKEQLL